MYVNIQYTNYIKYIRLFIHYTYCDGMYFGMFAHVSISLYVCTYFHMVLLKVLAQKYTFFLTRKSCIATQMNAVFISFYFIFFIFNIISYETRGRSVSVCYLLKS